MGLALFDSHSHLDAAEFDADREAVVQRAELEEVEQAPHAADLGLALEVDRQAIAHEGRRLVEQRGPLAAQQVLGAGELAGRPARPPR